MAAVLTALSLSRIPSPIQRASVDANLQAHLPRPTVIRGPSREQPPTAATSPPALAKVVCLNSTNHA
jgi:hypothetical protein